MRLSGSPIGVSGTPADEATLSTIVDGYDRELITGPVDDLVSLDLSLLVLSDREALCTAIDTELDTPLLPVGVPESGGVGTDDMERAIELALTGEGRLTQEPVLRVTQSSEVVTALYDVTVMTGEPARISEYAVSRTGASGEVDPITHVRSDGVVVATPLGSRGYAKRVGGPPLGTEVDGVAVVPVSPFAVGRDAHVVAPPVQISVERDEGSVELFADGRLITQVDRSLPVSVSSTGTVPLVSVDEKT